MWIIAAMKLMRVESEAIYDAGKERVVEVLLEMSIGIEQMAVLKRRIEELERQLKQNSHAEPQSQTAVERRIPQASTEESAETDGTAEWRARWSAVAK